MGPEEGSHQELDPANTSALSFSAPKAVRNKCLLFELPTLRSLVTAALAKTAGLVGSQEMRSPRVGGSWDPHVAGRVARPAEAEVSQGPGGTPVRREWGEAERRPSEEPVPGVWARQVRPPEGAGQALERRCQGGDWNTQQRATEARLDRLLM